MNDGYRNLPAINEGGVFGTPATILPDGRGRGVPDPLRRRSRVRPQRRCDRQHRHAGRAPTTGTERLSSTSATRRLGARNYFNAKPQRQERVPQPPVRRLARRPDRRRTAPSSSSPTKASARTAASRARRVCPTAAELADAIAANGGVVNPVIAGLLARQPWPSPNQAPDEAATTCRRRLRSTNRVDSLIVKLDQHFGAERPAHASATSSATATRASRFAAGRRVVCCRATTR